MEVFMGQFRKWYILFLVKFYYGEFSIWLNLILKEVGKRSVDGVMCFIEVYYY